MSSGFVPASDSGNSGNYETGLNMTTTTTTATTAKILSSAASATPAADPTVSTILPTTARPPAINDEWERVKEEMSLARQRREEERAAGPQPGEKSLFETLQQNKAAKQEAFEESIRLKNQFRALDEDEIDFLDSVLESTRQREAELKRETNEGLDAFRRRRAEEDQRAALLLLDADEGNPALDAVGRGALNGEEGGGKGQGQAGDAAGTLTTAAGSGLWGRGTRKNKKRKRGGGGAGERDDLKLAKKDVLSGVKLRRTSSSTAGEESATTASTTVAATATTATATATTTAVTTSTMTTPKNKKPGENTHQNGEFSERLRQEEEKRLVKTEDHPGLDKSREEEEEEEEEIKQPTQLKGTSVSVKDAAAADSKGKSQSPTGAGLLGLNYASDDTDDEDDDDDDDDGG
ncbi:MAG: hypothetical protein M1825_002999 [Sarcosagium campestre]|nr:MAG: hypothetical protein M1825_002999 [Sarcosagium campestre]